MKVYRHRVVARFGLMHMIGTNLSVWLNVLVQETKHEILTFYNPENNSLRISHRLGKRIMDFLELHDSILSYDSRTFRLKGWTSSRRSNSLSSRRTCATPTRSQRTPSHVRMQKNEYNGIVGARCQPLPLSVYDRIQLDLRGYFIRYVEKHIENRIHAAHDTARFASSRTCLQVQ